MTTWNKVAGDVDDTLTVTLDGVDTLDDVTAATANVWTTAAHVTLPAAVADPAARTVVVSLAGWLETATPGRYSIEFACTFTGGADLTWPDDRPDLLIVRRNGDPTEE